MDSADKKEVTFFQTFFFYIKNKTTLAPKNKQPPLMNNKIKLL